MGAPFNPFVSFATGFVDEINDTADANAEAQRTEDSWVRKQVITSKLQDIQNARDELREAKKTDSLIDQLGTEWDSTYGTDVGMQLRQAALNNGKLLTDPLLAQRAAKQFKVRGVKAMPAMPQEEEAGTYGTSDDKNLGETFGLTANQIQSIRDGSYVPKHKTYVSNPTGVDYEGIETDKNTMDDERDIRKAVRTAQLKSQFKSPSKPTAGEISDSALGNYIEAANLKREQGIVQQADAALSTEQQEAKKKAAAAFDSSVTLPEAKRAYEAQLEKNKRGGITLFGPSFKEFYKSKGSEVEKNLKDKKQQFVEDNFKKYERPRQEVLDEFRKTNEKLFVKFNAMNVPEDLDVFNSVNPQTQSRMIDFFNKRKGKSTGYTPRKSTQDAPSAGGQALPQIDDSNLYDVGGPPVSSSPLAKEPKK